MKIDLQRIFTPSEIREKECFVCESAYTPSTVAIIGGPHGEELCETCFSYFSLRQEISEIGTTWPTWEQYQEFVRKYPEPLFASSEECAEAERLGLYDDFVELSHLA